MQNKNNQISFWEFQSVIPAEAGIQLFILSYFFLDSSRSLPQRRLGLE
jgi:hypothetical protein